MFELLSIAKIFAQLALWKVIGECKGFVCCGIFIFFVYSRKVRKQSWWRQAVYTYKKWKRILCWNNIGQTWFYHGAVWNNYSQMFDWLWTCWTDSPCLPRRRNGENISYLCKRATQKTKVMKNHAFFKISYG